MTRVRELVGAHAPEGLEESMSFGMIAWVVPLSTYPDTYNGQPLIYAALASQKNYMSLYLMCVYSGAVPEAEFRGRWAGAKRLNMGKSCVRFTDVEDLDLDLIAEAIERQSVDEFVEAARTARGRR